MYDVVVLGAGVGGLSAAALLARAGRRVLVLEANYLPGGCASSYWRRGYIFESGATTLMGFDPGQPLHQLQHLLQDDLGLPLRQLTPPMQVWQDGRSITRHQDRQAWIDEACAAFDQPQAQRQFWQLALRLSDFVWQAAARNTHFPPQQLTDWLHLARANHPKHLPLLRYAYRSTAQVIQDCGITHSGFLRFIDEQLMITAQATASQVPMLFAAPALCYTNYGNYYLDGGIIQLPLALIAYIGRRGGSVLARHQVVQLQRQGAHWQVQCSNGQVYHARQVLSNLPVWNMPTLFADTALQRHYQLAAATEPHYWGAFTMGLAVDDHFATELALHHQIILPAGQQLPHVGSQSVFVSMSHPADVLRCPPGQRVLAISTHAHNPAAWFQAGAAYDQQKAYVSQSILAHLAQHLSGFAPAHIRYQTASTPVSWQQWTLRHHGSVGGLPQRMGRSPFAWRGATSGIPGLFHCGDTVYPGQGIPGVALSGILAAHRMLRAPLP